MSRPTLALCMIVKNEAENLPRLFESIQGCFDEIHITDTGSTDETVAICNKYPNVTVHHFDWVDDFAQARNYSFSHAKTDYIMWMDADDVLSNAKAFLQWRDNAMVTADYWVATYHYAFDGMKRPSCSFIRERVVRRDRDFRWKYFIHEGIMPESRVGNVRTSYTPTWTVNHMRGEEDLKKDRSRNLKILEKNKDTLDSRMLYYYGKELFENQKPADSVHILKQAVAKPDLEMHDRLLGLQYLAYAYLQCNQFPEALEMAIQGITLQPNRAEYHVIAGDCMLKMGRPLDAVPYYSAAKACQPAGSERQASVIFHAADAYTTYPRNQLARIFANTNQMERAEDEARECMARFGNAEAQSIRDELVRIKTQSASFENARPCDDIVISTPPLTAYTWDGKVYRERAMGGSETAGIEMAEWLHKISGRRVIVFNMRDQDITHNGVQYISNQKVHQYFAENQPFLHIAWRHNNKLTNAPTFLWSHDLMTPGAEQIEHFVKILALTPFHKEYLQSMQGIPEDKIHVTRNGVVPDRFLGIDVEKKDPFKFVWPSSHDRGVDRAIRILKKVRETYPEVTLHVFYGYENLYKYGLGHLADRVKALIEENKDWVIYHGATEQKTMIEHFKTAAYWLYPSDWIETSCITASEVLCSGVYPIVRRIGGVVDTLAHAEAQGMASLIESECVTDQEHERFVSATRDAISQNSYRRVKINAEDLSWEKVAREWLDELPKLAGG